MSTVTIDEAIARIFGAQVILLSDLAKHPRNTLYDLARAVAADVDDGTATRDQLETIFDEIKRGSDDQLRHRLNFFVARCCYRLRRRCHYRGVQTRR